MENLTHDHYLQEEHRQQSWRRLRWLETQENLMVPYLGINILNFREFTIVLQMVTEIVRLCLTSRSRRFCSSPARKPGGIIDLCFSVRDANRKPWKDAPCLVEQRLSVPLCPRASQWNSCLICLLVPETLGLGKFGPVPYICACVEATPSPDRKTPPPSGFQRL